MSDQSYHRFLEEICATDVEYVRRKDVQYNSSWKRRGGVGAYFTIVRPWDRFVAMLDPKEQPGDQREAPMAARLNKPIPAFDVFAAIEAEGLSGPDGSLIACVRDLRRYLLLLEAEMTERVLVGMKLANMDLARVEEQVIGQSPVHDVHMQRAVREGITREAAKAKNYAEMYTAQGDDENRHAVVTPWIASWGYITSLGNPAFADAWDKVAQDVFRLRYRFDADEFHVVPEMLKPLYAPVYRRASDDPPGKVSEFSDEDEPGSRVVSYWLMIDRCPESERDRWRTLDQELNFKEWMEVHEYCELYSWTGEKYVLRPKWKGWLSR